MKELEDYHWFPPTFRNFQTDFIGFVVARFNVYGVFISYLKTLALPVLPMFDLCSGCGEPAISIFKRSNCFSRLLLSDKYPATLKGNTKHIVYEAHGNDVLEMEFKAGSYYTMFNSFHHFKDEDKLKIAQKINASGAMGFIVEILEPTFFCLLKVLFATTIGTLVLTPFIHPFSLKRLFFTYILPINIFAIAFDGIVSVLKSKSVDQYQKLFSNAKNSLEVFHLKNGLSPLVVIKI